MAAPAQRREVAHVQAAEVGALDDDFAGRRRVEPAGEVEQRGLAGARRAHDGDELAGCDRQADRAQRVDRGLAASMHARHRAQLEDVLAHRLTSVGFSGVVSQRLSVPRELRFAVVEPACLGLRLEDHRLVDEQPRRVGALVGLHLAAGQLAQRAQRRGALLLHDGADVDAGRRERHRELDRELVARAALVLKRREKPAVELVAAGVGEAVGHLAVGVAVSTPSP